MFEQQSNCPNHNHNCISKTLFYFIFFGPIKGSKRNFGIMVGVKVWNIFSIVFSLCFVYGFNYCGVNAINSKSESDLYDSFEHPQIWSTLLEQMTINE